MQRDEKMTAFVNELLSQRGGDAEKTARYMSDTLRIGSIKACRSIVHDVTTKGKP